MKKILIGFLIVIMLVSMIPTSLAGNTVKAEAYVQYSYELLNGKATIIGSYVLSNEKELFIPSSIDGYPVIALGSYSFSAINSVEKITVPKGVKTIGDNAFSGCYNLKSISIPSTVTEIGEFAFHYCTNLSSVSIPDNVTTIGGSAFNYCMNLKSVNIGKKVSSIGEYAFNGCNNIEKVVYNGTEKDKAKIKIGNKNECITEVKWKVNCDANKHKYSNACDDSCNVCKATRSIKHYYKDVVTKATLTKNGKIENKCSKCAKVAKTTTIYYAKTFKLSKTSYTYTGKSLKPTVTVKDSAGKTISSKYYTVTYASGRKNVGKYKVTIKFKGNYTGTKTLYFTINPVKTSAKLTAAKKALTVSISKKSSQVTGYEIQYATNKKFTKAKTTTVKSYKTTKTTLKKLSSKKTYYVRVRTYKTVGKTKYYSGWSKVAYKKTK